MPINLQLIKIAVIASIIAFLSIWVYMLKSDLKVAHADYKAIESALTAQSTIIESNRVDYERNLAEANKTNTVIQTRYQERVQVIYQWKENDNNVSCDELVDALDSYQY